MSKSRIFIHVSGSISAFKAAALVSMLVKSGYDVRCSLSAGGEKFLGEASLSGISGNPVIRDQFAAVYSQMDHIDIPQKWADLMLVYPASANTINRLAAGLADDFIGAAYLANNNQTPFWIAPAMNSSMFEHPATAAAMNTIGEHGALVLPTGDGILACGTRGSGRLLEPADVFERIERHFAGSIGNPAGNSEGDAQ
jgi:phosphopantothenoylcysteine decarboxylase